MYNLSVIYDYNEEGSWPAWMIIKPAAGGFDWKQETLYVPLRTPFQKLSRDEIDEYALGLSIVQTELVISTDYPDQLGVYLPRVKERIKKIRGESYSPLFQLSDIQHFVVQMSDVEIVMQMNLSSIFDFR
ncbi:hypothetical protein NYE70_23800 [Paenibacillus sp. FSL R5-0407]|uniref:hypothetical protein n=1 Tax=Paenibacillus sp. FSL R5-0407 TaxID=2975320 RepID=UPI0030FCCF61